MMGPIKVAVAGGSMTGVLNTGGGSGVLAGGDGVGITTISLVGITASGVRKSPSHAGRVRMLESRGPRITGVPKAKKSELGSKFEPMSAGSTQVGANLIAAPPVKKIHKMPKGSNNNTSKKSLRDLSRVFSCSVMV